MRNSIAVLLACTTALAACRGEDATVIEFHPGQVWKYTTRPGEEASRLIVCKIETDAKLGTIVHISLEDLAIKSPSSPDGLSEVVGHMPFAEPSLRDSVLSLETTRPSLPDYEEGYNMWKAAFDAGEGGVFTISVAAGIEFMEQALNR